MKEKSISQQSHQRFVVFMSFESIFLAALAAPFVTALVTPLAYQYLGRRGVVVPLVGSVVPCVYFVDLLREIACAGKPLYFCWDWVSGIPLKLSFVVDGFGGLFALLVAGMGVLIVWYAHFYMEHEQGQGRFFSYLLFFLGSMIGVAVSEHLLCLFLFWELTSLSSFLLIGFWWHKEKSRAGALKALLITTIGGLFMLAGFVLLGVKTGLWEWRVLYAQAPHFIYSTWSAWALGLILMGALTKSAQFPFHIWLPDAMEAPTPVSAFLHSATMVKAGIILIFRVFPIFADHPLWFPLLCGVGLTTFVTGSWLAMVHRDLKAILAYTTIAQLGLFTALQGCGFSDPLIRAGLVFHIFVHAFYKGSLFMLTGIIDHAAGTRDVSVLGGLRKYMPKTCVFFLLACGSLAGLPPFLGFVSKEAALETFMHLPWPVCLAAPIVFAGGAALSVGVAFRIFVKVFLGKERGKMLDESNGYIDEIHGLEGAACMEKPQPTPAHEVSWGFLLPPAILAVLGVAFGFFPQLLGDLIFPSGAVGLAEKEAPHFALWHGITVPLLISGCIVFIGILLFLGAEKIYAFYLKKRLGWNLNTVYDGFWEKMLSVAKGATDVVQTGSLTRYAGITVGFVGGVILLGLLLRPEWGKCQSPGADWLLLESLAGVSLCVSCVLVVVLRDRLARIVSLGAAGLSICVYFAFRAAPDLALTGFLVEIVMFVLILVVLKQLKEEAVKQLSWQRGIGLGVLCGLCGLGIGGLVFVGLEFPLGKSIFPYFIENARPLAGGWNVVNVIVVDFRGFDTLGEISVLCLAALGVFGLRRVWVAKEVHGDSMEMHRNSLSEGLPLSDILRTVSAVSFPLVFLFSLYMVFRGHNQPGGGFIGGLIIAGGLILELLSEGRDRFLRMFPVKGRILFVWGLVLAFVTGLVPLFFGYPFLTSFVFEAVHFSTASIFDFGVYFVVVGVTLEMIVLIEETKRRV